MFKRESYLAKIRPFINITELVKILVGIRRSGKSTMLELIKNELLESGVQENQLIHINFEDMTYSFTDILLLHNYLKEKIDAIHGRAYLFLDEVQEISGWEKVINSLRVNSNVDIYVTGSNASMLSSEYATLLSGRYIEITIYPFSFSEYYEAQKDINQDVRNAFNQYLKYGGMPFIITNNLDDSSKMQYLKDIYNSVLVKDIIKRENLRDVDLLERILYYVMANIGRQFSATSISKYFKNERRTASIDTIINYLNAAEKAFLFFKLKREDIEGKELLKISEKYYSTDIGLRQAICGKTIEDILLIAEDIELVLENVVCIALMHQGFSLKVGMVNGKEVDFIATKDGKKVYVQVAYVIKDQDTVKREFGSLMEIKDNWPKYVISTDEFDLSRNGIIHMNIRDFLLNPLK